MKIAVAGVNHRTAPVEVRERLAVAESAVPEELSRLSQRPGLREAVILSTCNRVELALAVEDSIDPLQCAAQVFPFGDELRQHLFVYEGHDAIRHLFRVAASLDSMIVGEPQILSLIHI